MAMTTAAFPEIDPRGALELLRPLACKQLAEEEEPPATDWDPARSEAAVRSPGSADMALVREVEALYRRHHRMVFRLALRYGGGSKAWAEDVTQDVFVGLFHSLSSIADRDEMEGWLYRATANRCLNRLRRERFLSLAPVRWLLGEQKPEPRHPDSEIIARDDLKRALATLETLPPKERVAFYMYFVDDRDQDDIGRTLGHSKSYVCKLIQRAVARLREAGWEVDDAADR